jgi:hypothetical protein
MSTLGYTFLGKSKKFEIFNILGIKNDNRNALNTSRNILKSFKLFKKIMDR